MKILKTIHELETTLNTYREQGKSIGLVPTMGALHAGHASLVRRCASECDIAVVSVFVNPTQFNDKTDLANYPRTLDADAALLESLGANFLFAPTADEVYPEPDTRQFSFPPIDTVMEGARRPGHFNGVCQIVSKLFMWVRPDRAYFGEKDFQQIAVVRAMTRALKLPLTLVPCPIVREASGLALSSRNALLTPDEKQTAIHISRILKESVSLAASASVDAVHRFVVDSLNAIEGLRVEYFEIVNAETMQTITNWDEAPAVQGCITVFCGARPVRLIDNIKYK